MEPGGSQKQSVNIHASTLFWINAMLFQFLFRAIAYASLFAHGLATDAVLTGLADTAFKKRYRLRANHAFSIFLTHGRLFYSKIAHCQALPRDVSVQYLNL